MRIDPADRVRRTSGLVRFAVPALIAMLLLLVPPAPGRAAHGGPDEQIPHALDVAVAFPDAGLAADELLCFSLFVGQEGDFSSPAQSHCLAPGDAGVRFDGLTHGPYTLVVLAPGSAIAGNRYQGQVIATDLPDEPDRADYALPVSVKLAPEVAGATGHVRVSVFGCPPGTDAGGDAGGWMDECDVLANDVPVALSGVGSIEDTADQAVTGHDTAPPGRAEFSNLPPGDYQIDESLPPDAAPAAIFVESSIDGSIAPLDPDETLALRPTEVKSVAYFVVLDPEHPDPAAEPAPADAGALSGDPSSGDPGIDGGTGGDGSGDPGIDGGTGGDGDPGIDGGTDAADAVPSVVPPPPALIDPAITGGLPDGASAAEATPEPAG